MSLSNYKSGAVVLREAEIGDLIEFKRLGYEHWGVYVGHGYVIHVNLESKAGTNCIISRERLIDICESNNCRVNNMIPTATKKGLKAFDPATIVRNAERRIGDLIEYSLFGDNCEYFATKCRYGQAFCQQVERPSNAMVSWGTVGAVASAALIVTGLLMKIPGQSRQNRN